MVDTSSDNLRLILPVLQGNDNTWGQILNDMISEFELAVTGIYTNNALNSTDDTLNVDGDANDRARRAILIGGGTLSGNVNFIVPNEPKIYIVQNNTTGGSFTLGIKTVAGTRLDIPRDDTLLVWCDGADVFSQINAKPSGTIAQATNADQLGNVVAANYAQKAVKNQWTKPQIIDAVQGVITVVATPGPNTYTPNADTETTIIISQSEMERDNDDDPLKFLNPTGTPIDGQSLIFVTEQQQAAPLTALQWDTKYLFPDDTDIDMTQTIDKVDSFAFLYSANLAAWINFGTALNVPRSSP